MNTTTARGRQATGELPRVAWHISTRSENGGASCVEAGRVQDGTGRVALRHSHHPDATAFVSSARQWNTLMADIKAGSYDF